MGCFVSTKRASTSQRKDHAEVPDPPKPSERSKSPSHAEEEKVKEVLSVTTATKSEPQKHRQNKAFNKLKEEKEQEQQSKDEKKPLLVTQEETSHFSEVCSFMSDTMFISTTTTTATEHREDAEETRKRVNGSLTKPQKNRSFSGDHGTKREKKVHTLRNGFGSARLTNCKDQTSQRMVNGGTRNQPRRRDPGETSFLRPGSTATRAGDGAGRSVVGRCPSARRTNTSPRPAAPEKNCRKKEVPVREGKWDYASNETLENPLVSLECFIFI